MPYEIVHHPGCLRHMQRTGLPHEPEVTQVLRFVNEGCNMVTPHAVARLIAEWLGKTTPDFRLSWQYEESLQRFLVCNAWLSNAFTNIPCNCESIASEFKVDGHLYSMSGAWAMSDPRLRPLVPLLQTCGLKHIPHAAVSLEQIVESYTDMAEMLAVAFGIDILHTEYLIGLAVHAVAAQTGVHDGGDGNSDEILTACKRMRDTTFVTHVDKAWGHVFYMCKQKAAELVRRHVLESNEFLQVTPDFAGAHFQLSQLIPSFPKEPQPKAAALFPIVKVHKNSVRMVTSCTNVHNKQLSLLILGCMRLVGKELDEYVACVLSRFNAATCASICLQTVVSDATQTAVNIPSKVNPRIQ